MELEENKNEEAGGSQRETALGINKRQEEGEVHAGKHLDHEVGL